MKPETGAGIAFGGFRLKARDVRDANDMDDQTTPQKDDHKDLVRRHLKVLLLHLAAKSDNPSQELEALLHDVINELHKEVKEALEAKTHLRLVMPQTETLN
jgi:hypothetical protein